MTPHPPRLPEWRTVYHLGSGLFFLAIGTAVLVLAPGLTMLRWPVAFGLLLVGYGIFRIVVFVLRLRAPRHPDLPDRGARG